MSAFETYIRDLQEIRATGAAVKETSYYGALEKLLNELGKTLKPKVRCVMQLKNIGGAGMPDGGLFSASQFQKKTGDTPANPTNPERGVVEIKGTGDDAWVIAQTQQVSKYWDQYRQVLVTNYRDFVLIGQDGNGQPVTLETYRLAKNEAEFWQKAKNPKQFAEEQEEQVTEYLKRVMLQSASIVWSYTIGGYQVIKKWLSYREQELLGRSLKQEEVIEVTQMARRITAILLLEPELDANYQAVKQSTYPWSAQK